MYATPRDGIRRKVIRVDADICYLLESDGSVGYYLTEFLTFDTRA